MYFEDVMQAIMDTLAQCDGEYIAEVHNEICTRPIEYQGDSMWDILPLPTSTFEGDK